MIIKKFLLLIRTLGLLAGVSQSHADEPLHPDEAFKFDAVVDGNTIRASWTAADDYYMYKDKIRFESGSEDVELGNPDYPKGKMKHGITPEGKEGEVETYSNTVTINIPITKSPGGDFKLIAFSQGCAEKLGICYPPQKREKTLTLAALQSDTAQPKSALAAINDLSSQLGLDSAAGADEPLHAEQAFQYSGRVEGNTLFATWTIAREYYMYKEKFSFKSKTAGITFGTPKLPKGKLKHGIKPDGTEGEVETYMDHVVIEVPILANQGGITKLEYVANGQGCAEVFGICYPPIKSEQVATAAQAFSVGSQQVAETSTKSTPDSQPAVETEDESFWDVVGRIAFAFFSGLGLTFTPCVLPMLPIISSIIVGQGENVTKARGGLLATIYVLGTAVVWTAAGYVAGATGEQLQAYTSHPYFIIPVAVVLLLLSLAMFGLYNLQMPSFLQSKAQESSSNLKGGTFFGVFMMGVLASIIAGACVSPILILNLAVALETQNAMLGGGIMLAMALGMGVPIILVGIGAGWLLPKAGTWMDTVKYVFGVLLVGLAIYILSLIHWMPVLYFWAPFLIVTGVFMGATQPIAEGASGWKTLWKGIGIFLIIWGIFALLGAMQGNRDILQPVQLKFGSVTVGTSGGIAQQEHLFTRVYSVKEIDDLLAKAKAEGKPALVDYYATWCTDCNLMEKKTFSDPEVRQVLSKDFVLIQPDVTDQYDDRTQPMKDRFKVFGPPAMIFIDSNGNEKKDLRTYGFKSKEKFLGLIKQMQ